MLHRTLHNKIIRCLSLFLATFVVAAMHTETVAPQASRDVTISKISRDRLESRSPQTQRRAIVNVSHESGVVDTEYRRLSVETVVMQRKVVQAVFYMPPSVVWPQSWYLLTFANGRRHSVLYA